MVRGRSNVYHVLALVLLSSCGSPSLGQLAETEGVAPDAIVRVEDDLAFAARVSDGRITVLSFDGSEGTWVAEAIAGASVAEPGTTVGLFTLGGETGERWNTWVYGTASSSASRVALGGFDGEGGQVADGAWLIVLEDKDVAARDLEWSVLDALGAILDSGTGIQGQE